MTFKRLSEYFQLLQQNASRLKMTEILADLFKECQKEEIDKVCYLSLGRLLPQYYGVEFQMAQKMMERAITKAFGVDLEKVKRRMRDLGDLGEAGEEIKVQSSILRLRSGQEFKDQKLFEDTRDKGDLGVLRVYDRLLEIAKEAGEGSVERKIEKMAALLQDLDALSVRFVIRMPLGKMRLGFSEMTILDALSWMKTKDKSLRSKLEDAYNVVADIGEIAEIVQSSSRQRQDKVQSLARIRPKLGTPILPALCQRIGTAEEMVEKLREMAVEPKYDGTRLQVHFRRCKVAKLQSSKEAKSSETLKPCVSETDFIRIFTRNLENVTNMFPDIVEALSKEVKADEVVLDGEGVGFDPKTNKFLPFQETIKRKRKYNIGQTAKEIPLKYFVFDVLYKDGESLMQKPLSERRKILEKIIPDKNQKIILSPQIVTNEVEKLRKYHDWQIKKGLEGVVVKKWNSLYDAGRRDFNWVKFKQEEGKKGGGLADTIDCIVMGIYRGKGKRTDFGVGAFLVGVKKGEKYVTVSKIGTGLTDEQWRQLKVQSSKFKVKERPNDYDINKNLYSDAWCKPGLIVEIQADNITKSPLHTAGLALRFPRLVRFRDDKSADQITTVKELEKLFGMQFGKEK